MTGDEYKALRLRRSQLRAELTRIEALLRTEPPINDLPEPIRQPPIGDNWAKIRKDFYRDAENDFRNTDSNGNYVTPEEC